ncbi:MAG: hypothetical protein ABUL54_14170, partial [Dongia sp.]
MRVVRGALLILLCAVVGVFTACDRYSDDVQAVRAASSIVPGMSNDVVMITIAGARGQVDWEASRGDGDNVIVAVFIDRLSGSGTRHKVEFDFIHDRKTAKVTFDGVRVDG